MLRRPGGRRRQTRGAQRRRRAVISGLSELLVAAGDAQPGLAVLLEPGRLPAVRLRAVLRAGFHRPGPPRSKSVSYTRIPHGWEGRRAGGSLRGPVAAGRPGWHIVAVP